MKLADLDYEMVIKSMLKGLKYITRRKVKCKSEMELLKIKMCLKKYMV